MSKSGSLTPRWSYAAARPFVPRFPQDMTIDPDTGESLPSLTREEFAPECDINTLMSRFEKTGVLTHINRSEPQYLDLSDVPDLQRSMEILSNAENAFMSLSAQIRAKFDNDPMKFVEFAQNPDNLDAMRGLGLAEPLKPEPAPQKVEIVNPAPEAVSKPAKGSPKGD